MSEREQNGFEQVEEVLVKSETFLEKNLSKIAIAVGTVLVIIGAWYGYVKLIQEPRNEKASVELFKAEDHFINQQDSLAMAGAGLTEKGLDAIIKEYPGTDAANIALAYKGIALYDAERYTEAIEALKGFSSRDAYVAPSVMRLIGDCYVQLEKYQEAADAYLKAAAMAKNDAISPSCLIKAGHVFEKLGQKDKALELYNEIKSNYYTAPEAASVETDIIRVSAQ